MCYLKGHQLKCSHFAHFIFIHPDIPPRAHTIIPFRPLLRRHKILSLILLKRPNVPVFLHFRITRVLPPPAAPIADSTKVSAEVRNLGHPS